MNELRTCLEGLGVDALELLAPSPGDVVHANLGDYRLPITAFEQIREQLRITFPNNQVIVTDRGIELEIVSLKPGDVVHAYVPHTTDEQAREIRERLEAAFPNNEVVVEDASITVST